jgi:hypothetical protein
MRKSMRQLIFKLCCWTKGRQPMRAPKSKPLESRWLVKAKMKQVNLSRGYLFPNMQKTKASCICPIHVW